MTHFAQLTFAALTALFHYQIGMHQIHALEQLAERAATYARMATKLRATTSVKQMGSGVEARALQSDASLASSYHTPTGVHQKR
jgi:hypothetical protein